MGSESQLALLLYYSCFDWSSLSAGLQSSSGQIQKSQVDYTKEWVMRLCNPRVCGYPEAKPRDKCKQVGYSA